MSPALYYVLHYQLIMSPINLFIDSEASGNEENTLVVKKLASLIRPRYYSDLLGAGNLSVDFPPLYVFT